MNKFTTVIKTIAPTLSSIPVYWDGKQAIIEMKNSSFPHWKQMEWIGFYFQFLCFKHLSALMKIPGPKYGKIEFDGFLEIPWDFKAHSINTSSHQIIVNDSQAVSAGISQYGYVGVILAMGEVTYNDETRSFQHWHSNLKGGVSKFEQARILRGAWSRLRKTSFNLEQVSFILLDDHTLIKTSSFQTDFRNSNGLPRKSKVLIDLEKIDKEVIHFINFNG